MLNGPRAQSHKYIDGNMCRGLHLLSQRSQAWRNRASEKQENWKWSLASAVYASQQVKMNHW